MWRSLWSSGSRSSCKRAPKWLRWLALAGAALTPLAFAGCDEDDEVSSIDKCIEESIAQGRTSNWIQGSWRISGNGKRESCSEEAYNADTVQISSPYIRVHQQGHFVFLENTENPSFSLAGLVGDRCIHVRSVESTSAGVMSYDFPARFVGSSTFQGDFTSRGPGTCSGSGSFTVFAKLDAIPASAGNNPAPSDAGVSQAELCAACKTACEAVDTEYASACLGGCEDYVCHPKTTPDAGDAEAGTADAAEEDATQEDTAAEAAPDSEPAEAESDAGNDVEESEAGEAGDLEGGEPDADLDAEAGEPDGQADAGDAAEDAGEGGGKDATTDSSDPQYAYWDGSATPSDKGDSDGTKASCAMGTPGSGHGALWLLIGLVGLRRLMARR